MSGLAGYELGPVLAKGGMGAVHRATERASGRRVAVKRILPQLLDPDAVARFLLEGRAVARLDHPGIVAVHGAGEADGAPFLVMDLVEGESLARRLERQGPLSPAEACGLVARVADALAHAHARGVLHRDLKPANILVDASGAPRLIDFGLAKLAAGAGSLDHLTRTGELVGTPAYMAPEQANGGAVDARTDVYGLGATLHALLTGGPPFDGPNAVGVLHGVLTRPPSPPSARGARVSAALDRLVLDCLAKEPAARPASMVELARRLEACEGAPARRAPVVVLGSLAAVALVAGGLALSRGGGRAAPAADVIGAAPVASAVASAPTSAAAGVRRTRGWPAEVLERTRIPDVERELQPPPDGAPAPVVLERARALRRAGRLREARALLPRLDPADRDGVLLRLQLGFELDPPGDPAALDRAIAADPGWAEGLYVREVQRMRTEPDEEALRAALARLDALRRADLRTCLEVERYLLEPPAPARLGQLFAELEAALPSETVVIARAELFLVSGGSQARPERALQDRRIEETLDSVLERAPLLARAHELRWRLRRLRQDHVGAARGLRELAGLAVERDALVPLLLMEAWTLTDGGEVDDGLACLPPGPTDDATTEHCRGVLLRALGREAEAVAVFQGVLDDALPGPPVAYAACAADLRGAAREPWPGRYIARLERDLASAREWLDAVSAFPAQAMASGLVAVERALELGAGRPGRHRRAALLRALGRRAEGLAELDQLVAEAPEDRWALAGRAAARLAGGDRRGAAADADEAARLPPAPALDPSSSHDVGLLLELLDDLRQGGIRPPGLAAWGGALERQLRRQSEPDRPLPDP